ncbi:mitochondrial carrier [Lentithecium fluviatile CBS 122367]|uniref:Mitochondrial carrier n=1 Tax=Lentithecium fluviatile CBS 122367 TaxID=1168545 RepID=A0A6G1IYP1_9PLEO|nr:mitochondrial carrier [Lentithecium fluviatile CBS 122367]
MSATVQTIPIPGEVAKMEQEPKATSSSIRYPFWFGGSATAMAACVTHPFDLLKVRLQTRTADAPRTLRSTFHNILKTEGPIGLYSGISAAILRQLSYSTVRFAIYEEMKQHTSPSPSFPLLIAMATSSGFIGGLAGNWADVINVRMQNDASLPLHARRNYKHAIDGLLRMTREEGMRSWFRGWAPNCTRAAATTAGQLATYDVAKRMLMEKLGMQDVLSTQLLASLVAGVTTATVTNPIDVIKTRAMSAAGKQGVWNLVRDLSRREGVRWVVKGWVPSFIRQGP